MEKKKMKNDKKWKVGDRKMIPLNEKNESIPFYSFYCVNDLEYGGREGGENR
uniref:Uncharacterized protein n=1 Tax=Anguilla anguilla TaxID=7936 RepID=A0A0E9VWE4_ANGAN